MDGFTLQNVAHHRPDVTQPPTHPLPPQSGIGGTVCVTASRPTSLNFIVVERLYLGTSNGLDNAVFIICMCTAKLQCNWMIT